MFSWEDVTSTVSSVNTVVSWDKAVPERLFFCTKCVSCLKMLMYLYLCVSNSNLVSFSSVLIFGTPTLIRKHFYLLLGSGIKLYFLGFSIFLASILNFLSLGCRILFSSKDLLLWRVFPHSILKDELLKKTFYRNNFLMKFCPKCWQKFF